MKSFSSLLSSQEPGYIIESLPKKAPLEKDEKETKEKDPSCWPINPGQIKSAQDFKDNVAFLSKRALQYIEAFPQGSVEAVKIGKTSVTMAKHKTFDPSVHTTWRYGSSDAMSPGKRWADYKQKGYRCLIVLACFDHDDVPPSYKHMEQHQQHVALAYEAALDKVMKEEVGKLDPPIKMAKGDPGGGGRATLDTQYAGGILYMAIHLTSAKPTESEGENKGATQVGPKNATL